MNSLSRSFSLALLMLAIFLGIALTMQWWLRRESMRLQRDAVATKLVQLNQLLSLAPRDPEKWDQAFEEKLGQALGGRVSLADSTRSESGTAGKSVGIFVETPLPGHPDRAVRLVIDPIAAQRLTALQNRVLAVTVLSAAFLLTLSVLLGASRRDSTENQTRTPWRQASAEMGGLERLARISEERGHELQRESGARQRAEEDLQTNRTLLSQSHEERARLGRDLHDNICQTLYAVSLTLESIRKKISATPEVWQRLDQSIVEVRRLNQEVRAYLRFLEPEQIQRQSFTEAVQQMLDILPTGADLAVTRQFDEEAVAMIRPAQAAEVVNILREAVSNATRHGHARHITLRAERDDTTVALAVQDDGTGMSDEKPAKAAGHGLANMRARAEALGATLRIESELGRGTRVLLLLPVTSTT
jgi:signal transduction histidine kinase